MIRLTVPLLLAAGLSMPALAQSGPVGHEPTLLLHGNYCGPGNNAPAAPIDALTAQRQSALRRPARVAGGAGRE